MFNVDVWEGGYAEKRLRWTNVTNVRTQTSSIGINENISVEIREVRLVRPRYQHTRPALCTEVSGRTKEVGSY